MVMCLEQGADLHMAQLMPLPLTVSCFSKIQIGFAFLVPAHPGSLGKRAVKRVCVSGSAMFLLCEDCFANSVQCHMNMHRCHSEIGTQQNTRLTLLLAMVGHTWSMM